VADEGAKRPFLAPDPKERYSRLSRFAGLGDDGLAAIRARAFAVVGVGGLGARLAETFARYGAERLIIIDRDVVTFDNLGHQALYTEADAERRLPKAVACAEHVRAINSSVDVQASVDDLTYANVAALIPAGVIMLDGLDNFATRYLLNDYALATHTPYVYGGVAEDEGSAKAVVPGVTSCLRCHFETPPAPGETRTCDAYGVFAPLIGGVTAIMAGLAARVACGRFTADDDRIYQVSAYRPALASVKADKRPGCPACGGGRYDFLTGKLGGETTKLCGSLSVQTRVDLAGVDAKRLAKRLARDFAVMDNGYCVTAQERSGLTYTIFPAGRIMVTGTTDERALRTFVAKYIGG
jgi:adenylyltransferase/sulfurtransferase